MCDNNKIDKLVMYSEVFFIFDGCELFMFLIFEC